MHAGLSSRERWATLILEEAKNLHALVPAAFNRNNEPKATQLPSNIVGVREVTSGKEKSSGAPSVVEVREKSVLLDGGFRRKGNNGWKSRRATGVLRFGVSLRLAVLCGNEWKAGATRSPEADV